MATGDGAPPTPPTPAAEATAGWGEAEWNAWFAAEVAPYETVLADLLDTIEARDQHDGATSTVEVRESDQVHYERARDHLEQTYGRDLTSAARPLVGPSGGQGLGGILSGSEGSTDGGPFDGMTPEQKRAFFDAWSAWRLANGSVRPEPYRPPKSKGWVMWVPITAVVIALAILAMMLGRDAGPEEVAASGGADVTGESAPGTSGATPVETGIPPRPETDEPATLSLTGEDPCGNLASMQQAGVELAAGPGEQGGQIRFLRTSGPDAAAALTGVMQPGADGPTWEDSASLEGGVADEQLLDGIVVGDGLITASLSWTDHDGCTTTPELSLAVPTALTDWLLSLPPAGPSDCRFTGELTYGPEDLVVTGVLVDAAGVPVAGQELTIEVPGEELATYTAVTDAEGRVRVEVDSPSEDSSSAAAQVVKGAHLIAVLFLE